MSAMSKSCAFEVFLQHYFAPRKEEAQWHPLTVSDIASSLQALCKFLKERLPQYIEDNFDFDLEPYADVPETVLNYMQRMEDEYAGGVGDTPFFKYKLLERIVSDDPFDRPHAGSAEDILAALRLETSQWTGVNKSAQDVWIRSWNLGLWEDERVVLDIYPDVMESLGLDQHAQRLRSVRRTALIQPALQDLPCEEYRPPLMQCVW